MSPSRYELSDLQWEKIKDFLPGRKEHVGRTAADNRLFVNGVLWVLRSGARWADLPERYGKYKSVHKRFVRWANSGVWERVFHELVRDRKNQYLMLDSTIVRAHQQGATGFAQSIVFFEALDAVACAWMHLTLCVDSA